MAGARRSTARKSKSSALTQVHPHAVHVPAYIYNVFDERRLQQWAQAGITRLRGKRSMDLPVRVKFDTLAPKVERSMDFGYDQARRTTRVLKGGGKSSKFLDMFHEKRTFFDYKGDDTISRTENFYGGEVKQNSAHDAFVAKQIIQKFFWPSHDSVIRAVKQKYGLKIPPVHIPVFLARPDKLPEIGKNEEIHKLVNAKELLSGLGIPEDYIRDRAVYGYETPLHLRIKYLICFSPNSNNWREVFHFYGFDLKDDGTVKRIKTGQPVDLNLARKEIGERFAASLGLGTYIVHKKLNGTFTSHYAIRRVLPRFDPFNNTVGQSAAPYHCSLKDEDVDASGTINDFDTAGLFFPKREKGLLKDCQENDLAVGSKTVKKFLQMLWPYPHEEKFSEVYLFDKIARGEID